MAKPKRITPELLDEVLELIKQKYPVQTACEMVGICKSSWYRAIKEDTDLMARYQVIEDNDTKISEYVTGRHIREACMRGDIWALKYVAERQERRLARQQQAEILDNIDTDKIREVIKRWQ